MADLIADATKLLSATTVATTIVSFAPTTFEIIEVNCSELKKNYSYDYYKDMIYYKYGFISSAKSFVTNAWLTYIIPWEYNNDM